MTILPPDSALHWQLAGMARLLRHSPCPGWFLAWRLGTDLGRLGLQWLDQRQQPLGIHSQPGGWERGNTNYEYWRSELPDTELTLGIFGENFTVIGLREEELNIGDRFKIGNVELMVTQPRLPCYKLGIRFGRSDMVKRFLASRRTGFYFRVLQEGEVGVGDTLELMSRNTNNITVADITQLYVREQNNPELLHHAAQLEALPESWRDYFQEQIRRQDVS